MSPICPECGSDALDRYEREEQHGPWICSDCGWTEDGEPLVVKYNGGSEDVR